jgi:serine/threonine protein kinase
MNQIKYEKLLGSDLYITFKGEYLGHPVIIKFFTEVSDQNNEYEVLDYLQKHSASKELFPKTYLQVNMDYSSLTLFVGENQQSMTIEEIYKVIVYEYIEGTDISLSSYNQQQAIIDVGLQLSELHRLGFVHGDVKINNIIQTNKETYYLIDYGRTFSVSDPTSLLWSL